MASNQNDGKSTKRKHEDAFERVAETVATHYNSRGDQGLRDREKSRIFYMRNYNNWIKSMLINHALNMMKPDGRSNRKLSVLDLCSGKGGDLLKWKVAGIGRLVCVDIAETSVEHCKARYEDLRKRPAGRQEPLFSANFFTADCSKERIAELEGFPQKETFDLTSCQFALHYSFESLAQARMMLKNACENIREGGLFIGTIPNAQVLVKRLRDAEGMSFGNDIYKVEFDVKDKESIPLFGTKYHFFLEGVVNCPEFLVYFPLLEELAKDESMELVDNFTFKDFHDKHCKTQEGQNLLRKMLALEPYPPQQDKLLGKRTDYTHAKSKVDSGLCNRVWTLSEPEWEATNLYMVFMFKKVSKSSRAAESPPKAQS